MYNKKYAFGLIGIILTIAFAVWHFSARNIVYGFYNISEWGAYSFILPMICSYILAVQKINKKNLLISLSLACLGITISIALQRELENAFYFQKIGATIVGGVIIWSAVKRFI